MMTSPKEKEVKKGETVELETTLDHYITHLTSTDWEAIEGQSFSENTIKRARNLIVEIMDYFSEQRIDFFPPKLLPLLDGSLDITWKNRYFRLIINIPNDTSQLIEIYGDIKIQLDENNEIDCRINYSIVKTTVIEWLKKTLRYGQ